jgi:hypothetical protein
MMDCLHNWGEWTRNRDSHFFWDERSCTSCGKLEAKNFEKVNNSSASSLYYGKIGRIDED